MVFSSASGGCESKSLLVSHQVCDLGFCLPESSACNMLLILTKVVSSILNQVSNGPTTEQRLVR